MIDYNTLEIVGHDEVVETPCGLFRPLFKEKTANRFFFLNPSDDNLSFVTKMSRDQVEEKDEAKRLTLFRQDSDRMPTGEKALRSIPAAEHAVVVFATEVFRRLIGHVPMELLFRGEPILNIQRNDEPFTVTCVTEDRARELLDGWGTELKERALAQLLEFHDSRSSACLAKADNAITFGLYAAEADSLRDELHVFQGAVAMNGTQPENVSIIYDLAQEERENWTWSTFYKQVEQLNDVLRIRTKKTPSANEALEQLAKLSSQHISAHFQVQDYQNDEARLRAWFEKEALIVQKASSLRVKLLACRAAAKRRSQMEDFKEMQMERLLHKAGAEAFGARNIQLTQQEFKVLLTEPIAYFEGVIGLRENISLNLIKLTLADTVFKENRVDSGVFAPRIIHMTSIRHPPKESVSGVPSKAMAARF